MLRSLRAGSADASRRRRRARGAVAVGCAARRRRQAARDDAAAVRLQRRGQPDAARPDAVDGRRLRHDALHLLPGHRRSRRRRRRQRDRHRSRRHVEDGQLSALLSRRHQAAHRHRAHRHGAPRASRVRLLRRRWRARCRRPRAAHGVGDGRCRRRARHRRRQIVVSEAGEGALVIDGQTSGGDRVHHADGERVGAKGGRRSGGDAAQGHRRSDVHERDRPRQHLRRAGDDDQAGQSAVGRRAARQGSGRRGRPLRFAALLVADAGHARRVRRRA